jgi:type IV secretory pathway VirB3-like protein
MTGDSRLIHFDSPVHHSLLEPVNIAGVSRIPAIFIGVIGGVLVLAMHKVGGLLVVYALWVAAKRITQIDPFFFDIILRQIRAKLSFIGN